MSLETYTGYIPALVPANPLPTDAKSQGDDHLRGIKKTLATQFSGFTEPDVALEVKASTLNAMGLNGVEGFFPVGGMTPYAGPGIPQGYLLCNGAAVSRTTYSQLYFAIGTFWGAGDGTSTFNLPDMRGYFPRGAGVAGSPGGATTVGGTQTDDNKGHTHGINLAAGGSHTHTEGAAGAHSHTVSAATNTAANTSSGGGATTFNVSVLTTSSVVDHTHTIGAATHTHSGTSDSSGGTETRPFNKAVNFIIRAGWG